MRFTWKPSVPFLGHGRGKEHAAAQGKAPARTEDPLLVEIGLVAQLTHGKGDDDYDAPAAGYFDVPDPLPEPGGEDEGEERPAPDEEDEDEE